MVGVPGRSKGCLTCRQRKIACGLQRPVCAQCIKSKRKCAGYRQDTVFIYVQPGEKEKQTELQEPKQGSPRENSGNLMPISARHDTYSTFPFMQLCATGIDPSADIIFRASNRQFVLNGFVSQCLSALHNCQVTKDQHWLLLLPELPMDSKALEASVLALSTASLGRLYNDNAMITESLKLYTKGLYELQKALYSPSLVNDDSTLAACMAMCLYELLECPADGRHGYEGHCKGLLTLIKHRGVHSHTSGLGRLLYKNTRAPVIMHALQYNSPTLLAEREWLEIPWQNDSKLPIDRILDCFAQAPGIYNRSSKLHSLSPPDQLNQACEIAMECWELNTILVNIYEELESSAVGPPFWVIPRPEPMTDNNGSQPFGESIAFPDLRTAGELMLYWAALIMLRSGLCDIYQLIQSIDPDIIDETIDVDKMHNSQPEPQYGRRRLPPLGDCLNYRSLVAKVCGSVPYFLRSEHGILATLVMAAPLGICQGTLAGKPQFQRETAWIKLMVEKIQWKGVHAIHDGLKRTAL